MRFDIFTISATPFKCQTRIIEKFLIIFKIKSDLLKLVIDVLLSHWILAC